MLLKKLKTKILSKKI